MSRLIFTPEMFEVERMATTNSGFKVDLNKYESAIRAQEIFDSWLEKQKIVYGKTTSFFNEHIASEDTHKAYLVCIEEIKKCEHKNLKITNLFKPENIYEQVIECKDCNKELKPKNGWDEI